MKISCLAPFRGRFQAVRACPGFGGRAQRCAENFTPMIKNKLNNTSYQEREDLEQELKMKICEKAEMLLCQEVPGFWEFITELLKVL
ncbi:sigma-O factor regulator RsoA [Bacillus licheniformis]|uniref:sigma-O factor regulator RsoA n=2 Tax=Bacillus licheniformis TaxID=1402 RepID=UPI0021BDA336|nr:sigma-O factor regulator RsoA [Bacillus licheniformis]